MDGEVITLIQGMTCVVDKEDYIELLKYRWRISRKGYAVRLLKVKGRQRKVFMHRQIMNTSPGLQTDHINHDKLDNRRKNLRICTPSQNQHNSVLLVRNTSGYKGVSWHKHTNQWRSYITLNGKTMHIGLFTNKEDAARAYNNMAIQLHGEYAFLNELKGD